MRPLRHPSCATSSAVSWATGRIAAGLFGALAGFGIQPADAGLRVCNGSLDLVNVAIGYETDDGIRTEGWWTVTANACSQVIQGVLTETRYYLHVADGFGESRLSGDISLCIRDEKFVLYDGDQCWQRGLIAADFFQVDTEGAQDWTVLLSYD